MKVGAAVFVKSPGITPLKTRLARHIGKESAEVFYRYSCLALREILESGPLGLYPHWALAEAETSCPLWHGWPHLWQGLGELGCRLDKIYQETLQQFGASMLLGADAPQIDRDLLKQALELGEDGSFVIGPASDGGFYLLLGSQKIPFSVWNSVPYSSPQTLACLEKLLAPLAPIRYLPQLTDVDEYEDLINLANYWQSKGRDQLLPAQLELFAWIRQLFSAASTTAFSQ